MNDYERAEYTARLTAAGIRAVIAEQKLSNIKDLIIGRYGNPAVLSTVDSDLLLDIENVIND